MRCRRHHQRGTSMSTHSAGLLSSTEKLVVEAQHEVLRVPGLVHGRVVSFKDPYPPTAASRVLLLSEKGSIPSQDFTLPGVPNKVILVDIKNSLSLPPTDGAPKQ